MDRTRRNFDAEMLVWGAVIAAVFLLEGLRSDAGAQRGTIFGLGAISALFGVRAFLGHGGGRITTLGLFNFASALFIGYAGIQDAVEPMRRSSPGYIVTAVSLALAMQIAVTMFAWRRAAPSTEDAVISYPSVEQARRITVFGLLVLGSLLFAQRVGIPQSESGYADGAAFSAALVIAVGILMREDTRLASLRILILLAVFAVYVGFFHQGSGRLRLVALACGLGLLLTARFPSRSIKVSAVLAAPAAIWWLAQDRLALQESLAAGSSQGRSGLESMTSPILVLGQLIEAQAQGFGLAWGTNFFSLPLAVAPAWLTDSWRPGALGYELVRVSASERFGTGYSVAGTATGEWVFNFGVGGVVVAIPATVWLLSALDRRLRQALRRMSDSPRHMLYLVVWVLLCGGIADLAWSGTHTWGARTVSRLPVLVLMGLFFVHQTRSGTRECRKVNGGFQKMRKTPLTPAAVELVTPGLGRM